MSTGNVVDVEHARMYPRGCGGGRRGNPCAPCRERLDRRAAVRAASAEEADRGYIAQHQRRVASCR